MHKFNDGTNLVNRIIDIFVKNLDILVFMILVTLKVLFYGKQIATNFFSYKYIMSPVIASVLIIVGISLLFKNKRRTRFLYILNIIISIFIIADLAYFRYYKDIISIGAIRNAFLLGGVASSIGSLFKATDILYVIDIIIFIPLMRFYKRANRKENKLVTRVVLAAVIIFGAGALNNVSISKLAKEQPGLLHTMSNRIYITKVLGSINFHAIDAYQFTKNTINNMKPLPKEKEDEIKSVFNDDLKSRTNNLQGQAKGKNLIVIQVEALQQFVINSKIEGKEVTPNLNRWLKKSRYFDNYFYQVAAGNTSDAEFLSNNSVYPAASGAAYYLYSGNKFNSLPKTLGDEGYYTAAMHGYKNGFWNRNVMYKAQKFDDFYGETNYKMDEKVGLGLSDKSFLNQSLEKMKSFKKPFYSFVVTLSSHFPYDDVKGYEKDEKFNVGKYEGTFMGNYLKGIHYTDTQLGMFLDKLEKEGYMDDSLIVLYGDHNAISKNYIQQLYDFVGEKEPNDMKWYQLQKVPMFIHFPKDKYKGVDHTYSGQIDLYPTLANLYDLPKEYMLGNDLFNSKNTKVTFRNGSYTDGKVFYVSWTGDYYDIKTGEKIPENQKVKLEKERSLKDLQTSDDFLNHNLMKNLNIDK